MQIISKILKWTFSPALKSVAIEVKVQRISVIWYCIRLNKIWYCFYLSDISCQAFYSTWIWTISRHHARQWIGFCECRVYTGTYWVCLLYLVFIVRQNWWHSCLYSFIYLTETVQTVNIFDILLHDSRQWVLFLIFMWKLKKQIKYRNDDERWDA